MTQDARLRASLADRYRVERELGVGGMVYRKEIKAISYDVFPGGRELVVQKFEAARRGFPIVVLNWPGLLQRRGSRPSLSRGR